MPTISSKPGRLPQTSQRSVQPDSSGSPTPSADSGETHSTLTASPPSVDSSPTSPTFGAPGGLGSSSQTQGGSSDVQAWRRCYNQLWDEGEKSAPSDARPFDSTHGDAHVQQSGDELARRTARVDAVTAQLAELAASSRDLHDGTGPQPAAVQLAGEPDDLRRLREYLARSPLSKEPPSLADLTETILSAQKVGSTHAIDMAISQLTARTAQNPALVFALAVTYGPRNLLVARDALARLGPLVQAKQGRAVEDEFPREVFRAMPTPVLQAFHCLRDWVSASVRASALKGWSAGFETPLASVGSTASQAQPFLGFTASEDLTGRNLECFQTITAAPGYSARSLEELRVKDYAEQRKGPPQAQRPKMFQEVWEDAAKKFTLE